MPERRGKRIAFLTDGPPFDGGSIAREAVGGSETALIQAAAALAARGHAVTVFCRGPRPGVYEQVTYRPVEEFPGPGPNAHFDVVIVSRFYDFLALNLPAELRVLWNHDTLDQPAGLRAVMDRVDLLLVLSRFHRDNFLTHLPNLEGRLVVTKNGLDFSLLERAVQSRTKDPQALIYASRPERGLRVLLENIWPRLLDRRPELKLHLCGYRVDPTHLAPGLRELYAHLEMLVQRSPNVIDLGPLNKNDYYHRLACSNLMLYPCTFPEISCLAALEAQACLTPVVTTAGFALAETVRRPEFLISGRPGSETYTKNYLNRVFDLLDHPEHTAELAQAARNEVLRDHSWATIAGQWDRLFDLFLASRRVHPGRHPVSDPHAGLA